LFRGIAADTEFLELARFGPTYHRHHRPATGGDDGDERAWASHYAVLASWLAPRRRCKVKRIYHRSPSPPSLDGDDGDSSLLKRQNETTEHLHRKRLLSRRPFHCSEPLFSPPEDTRIFLCVPPPGFPFPLARY